MDPIYSQAQEFLSNLFEDINKTNLNIDGFFIDHICYRTSSLEKYLEAKFLFSKLGELLIESPVGGRSIATYKLQQPIKFLHYKIPLIEVPSPKKESPYTDGFEHIEIVINDSFDIFMKKYSHLSFNTNALGKKNNPEIKIKLPSGSLKFHHQSLEKIIEFEKKLL